MRDINNLKTLFSATLAPSRIVADEQSRRFYGRDWLKDFEPAPALILFPETTVEVQQILLLCNQHRIAVVPSGGRTGLSGGATATNGEVVISLERMRTIVEINRASRLATCQAGVSLEQLQQAARDENLYFPVDFSSRGSAQIGGAIATNAGGIRVVRYGNIRDSVVGLTVVTATGAILTLNGSLFKNNSGYDLRNLFIGSEGTLGIITEATLKLTSPPHDVTRVLCGITGPEAILPLFTFCRDSLPYLSAFEFMERLPYGEVIKHRGLRDPLTHSHQAYILVECEIFSDNGHEQVTSVFAEAYEKGFIQDVVVSESSAQAHELISLRDYIGETLSQHYSIHKNDVSVPVHCIPNFIRELHESLHTIYPEFRVAVFGHVGDGNLHINVLKPDSLTDEVFFVACNQADTDIFTIVQRYGGSISAEHGVGLLKRDFLHFCRTDSELQAMRGIKKVFDPNGIMNPGKIFT